MIKILQLDNAEIVVNAELLETVEAKPDTIITLTTGRKIFTKNSVDEVIAKTIDYQRSVRSSLPVQANLDESPKLRDTM